MNRAIEQYLSYLKLANRSTNTLRCYEGNLLDFAAVVAETDPAKLTIKHIENYLHVLHRRQASKETVRRALAVIRSFCRWLVGEGILADNPAAVFMPPRHSVRVKQRASETETRALLAQSIRSSFPERDRLILELLYGSGLRCDECASLQVEDFYPPNKLLVSKGKGDKQRYVLLTDPAAAAMKVYLEKREKILTRKGMTHWPSGKKKPAPGRQAITGLFFGLRGREIEGLEPRSVRRIVVKLAADAGINWLRPHDLRRAFATHLWENGAPLIVVSRLLGHAKLSTTDLYISKASLDRLKRAYDRARRTVP